MIIDVRARELQPGDRLLATNRTVVSAYVNGYGNERGVKLQLRRADGIVMGARFNTSTTIRIEREVK